MSSNHRARLAVLASGSGSTFAAVVAAGRSGLMSADVVLLIASRPDLPAIERARSLGIPHVTLDERAVGRDVCDQEMEALLRERDTDLVVLAGWLRKIGPRTLSTFEGRLINTHPAPLPRFGGQGMFGDHVHRAVLESGVTTSAATVHRVDGSYDTGPIIAQVPVPVLAGDDVESLRRRVQSAERGLLIETINGLLVDVLAESSQRSRRPPS